MAGPDMPDGPGLPPEVPGPDKPLNPETILRLEVSFWRHRCLWAEDMADTLADAVSPLIQEGVDTPASRALARWARWHRARTIPSHWEDS